MPITHTKVSAVADGADTSKVRPSDWNASHSGTATPDAHATSHNVAGADTPIPLKYLDKGDSGAAAQTFDWTAATTQRLRLTGNPASFAFTAPPAGTWVALLLVQDGTGGRTIPAWPATVKWIGGAAPTLTSTANKKDIFSFFYDGTDYIGQAAQNA